MLPTEQMINRTILTMLSLALFAIAASGCSQDTGNAADRTSANTPFAIPGLKPRPEGLGTQEFVKVKQRYDQYSLRINTGQRDVEACVGLAQLFMNEARVTGDHPYYYPAAEKLLDEALRRSPNDLAALISKGSVLLSLHHFAEALEIAERARQLSPGTAIIHGIICDANVELGNYARAVQAADTMVALRPDLRSYSRVSYLREIHGDVDGAIDAMRMAVEAGAPGMEDTEWSRYMLGLLHLNQGELGKAEGLFRTCLQLRPNYPFALAGLARVRSAEGKMPEAITLLDSASTLIPEFSFAELQADMYRATGDTRRADSLVAAVEAMLQQDEAAGHLADKEFALLYANHGVKPEQAVERARKELARRPENIEAEGAMAWALLRAGRAAEARTYITKAMRMGTRDAVMLAHAGLIERALGNTAAATDLLRRSATANPHLPMLLQAQIRPAVQG